MTKEYYHCYKGVYYKFIPKAKVGCDIWKLSDDETNMIGNLATYNADYYRLDECMELFKTKGGTPYENRIDFWMPYDEYTIQTQLKNEINK